jgi:hypothetical protein
MAFHITHATPTPDGGWLLEEETKVRLAGADGPLARHIIGLPAESNGEWNLNSAELIGMLAISPPSAGEQAILLWDPGDPDCCPMRVLHFSGVSRDFETELLVHMEILESVEHHVRGTGRITNEALRLLGGRATPKAKWLWAAPKMSIGSTIVGAGRADGIKTAAEKEPSASG